MSNEDPKPKVPDTTENGDGPLIDPEVEEELEGNFPEDPFLTEYASHGDGKSEGSEKVDVTSDWIGEGDNWRTKTKLSAEQIIAMTQIRMLRQHYTELEEINPLLLEMVENMEQYTVSHKGLAREQHVDVLQAMHSGESPQENERKSMLLEAFAANTDNEE